jgi:hypothetical protein
MQFQVPQFIEVEDKIFGPLTFKQFVFVLGGIGFAYLFWRVLPLFIAAPLIAAAGGLAAALAFFQFNGRPFILALENGFYFLVRSKLYLWNNTARKRAPITAKPSAPVQQGQRQGGVYIPKLSDSRLHELAWSLDIKERIAAGVREEGDLQHDSVMAPVRTPQEILSHIPGRAPAI